MKDVTSNHCARIEALAREWAAPSPENLAALSPEATRAMLHEVLGHQIELERQNGELRRAQVGLEDSRARYFDLYDLAPVGYVTVSEPGLILEANLTACSLLGVDRSALIGRPLSRFIPREDVDTYLLLCKRLFESGEAQTAELPISRLDGSVCWVQLTAVTREQKGEAKRVGRVVLTNSTERRWAEERLQRLFKLIPDLVCIASTDGHFQEINPAWSTTLGYSEDEILAKPFLDFIHPDDRDGTMREVAQQLAGRETMQFTNRYRCKDGSYRWLEWRAMPAVDQKLLFAAARDITTRKQAEADLLDGERRFRGMFENVSDGILLVSLDGHVRDANPAACRMNGYTHDEFVGKHGREFVHPEHAWQFSASLAAIQAGLNYSAESVNLRKDGTPLPIEVHIAPFTYQGESVLLCSIRDISARKRAEEALRASEGRYSLTLDALNDGLWDWNVPSGRTFFSPNYYSLLGYDDREFQACYASWRLLVHPEDLVRVEEDLRVSIKNGKEFSIDLRMKLKSGHWRWVMTRGRVVEHDAEGKAQRMLGTLSDITVRKQAEVRGRESEEQFRIAIGALQEGFVTHDQDGAIVACNASMEQMLGLTTDQINGRTSLDPGWHVVHEDGSDFPGETHPAMVSLRQRIAQRDVVMGIHKPSGGLAWLSVNSVPTELKSGRVSVVVTARDITEQRKVEAALKRSQEAFQGYFEMGSLGMCVTSPEKGWLEVNGRLCQMLGYSKAELIGFSWAALTHPDDLGADLHLFAEVIAGKREGYELEKRFIRKDGSVVHTILSVTCQRQADGTVNHFLASLLDITERKQAEEALQSALRDKEALLNEVHHRVKNNLQVITSLLRLEEGRSEHPAAKSVLQEMGARILAMAMLHESLYRSGVFGVVDLGAYLREFTHEAFCAMVLRPASIRLHQELGSILVGLDQAMPCGLLVNELLCNSLKHGFPDGENGEVRIELQLVDGGPQVRLRVSNTGVGLPADFATRRGHSLGLQLVANLVRQLDGRLAIGPAPNAVFEVCFTPKPTSPQFSSPAP